MGSQQAQAIATPILSIFLLFNGFIITKPSAPAWLRWIFAISPNAYATQGIVVHIAEGFGAIGEFAVQRYGLEKDQDVRGVLVMVAMIFVFRVFQQVALTKCRRCGRNRGSDRNAAMYRLRHVQRCTE